MPVSEETYKRVALEDPDEKWELHCGKLVSKPPMTWEHDQIAWILGYRLQQQLPLEQYQIRVDAGRVRRSATQYFIPDVVVIPVEMAERLVANTGELVVFPEPLPFVAEVWSRSTGTYDARDKLPEYQRRGDREVWFTHPYDRTVTVWRQQPDGGYSEMVLRGGMIELVALPGVTVDLDELLNL